MKFTVQDIQGIPLAELFAEMKLLRQKNFGETVELCAIVNIKSGQCVMDCRFCAQSRYYKTETSTYPLLAAEILQRETEVVWRWGVHRVGWVASGCAVDGDELAKITDAAIGLSGGCLCASLGQLGKKSLERLQSAGVSRYHHNLETSERFYPVICATQRWSDRRKTVERAKEIGLEVCSGGLFGLGETWRDRIELAETLRELEVDSVPINFFNPIPGTPLGDRKPMSAEEGLRITALFRLMLPKTSIRICGGRPVILGARWPELFDAGAEALMTGNYLTTSGFTVDDDLDLISKNGLRIAETPSG